MSEKPLYLSEEQLQYWERQKAADLKTQVIQILAAEVRESRKTVEIGEKDKREELTITTHLYECPNCHHQGFLSGMSRCCYRCRVKLKWV